MVLARSQTMVKSFSKSHIVSVGLVLTNPTETYMGSGINSGVKLYFLWESLCDTLHKIHIRCDATGRN
jgi:hypothetical protein